MTFRLGKKRLLLLIGIDLAVIALILLLTQSASAPKLDQRISLGTTTIQLGQSQSAFEKSLGKSPDVVQGVYKYPTDAAKPAEQFIYVVQKKVIGVWTVKNPPGSTGPINTNLSTLQNEYGNRLVPIESGDPVKQTGYKVVSDGSTQYFILPSCSPTKAVVTYVVWLNQYSANLTGRFNQPNCQTNSEAKS